MELSTAAQIAAISLGAVYLLWGFFLAVMNLKQASDAGTLPRAALVAGTPYIITGYLLDMALNATLASILFLEPPKEKTLSERFKRWAASRASIRQKIAYYALLIFLHPFDRSGGHRACQ